MDLDCAFQCEGCRRCEMLGKRVGTAPSLGLDVSQALLQGAEMPQKSSLGALPMGH